MYARDQSDRVSSIEEYMLMFYLTIVNKTLRHRHSRRHNSNTYSKWFRFAFVQNAIFPNFKGSKGVAFEQNLNC